MVCELVKKARSVTSKLKKLLCTVNNNFKFVPGDSVLVKIREKEGDNKVRYLQIKGIVISRKGTGLNESVKLYKVSNDGSAVISFHLNSPIIEDVQIITRGKARRAKLNYLIGRSGKKARVKKANSNRDRE